MCVQLCFADNDQMEGNERSTKACAHKSRAHTENISPRPENASSHSMSKRVLAVRCATTFRVGFLSQICIIILYPSATPCNISVCCLACANGEEERVFDTKSTRVKLECAHRREHVQPMEMCATCPLSHTRTLHT